MKCIFCNHTVTQLQLDSGEAVTTGRDKYAHIACIGRHRAGDPIPFTTDTLSRGAPPVVNPPSLPPDDRPARRRRASVVIPKYPKLA